MYLREWGKNVEINKFLFVLWDTLMFKLDKITMDPISTLAADPHRLLWGPVQRTRPMEHWRQILLLRPCSTLPWRQLIFQHWDHWCLAQLQVTTFLFPYISMLAIAEQRLNQIGCIFWVKKFKVFCIFKTLRATPDTSTSLF